MIDISQRIGVIEALLEAESEASLTYAALESRLTIEQVCYDRLRISYSHISYEDLAKWQPRQVVQQVVEDANEIAASGFELSISKEPVRSDKKSMTRKEFEAQEYVKVGEQVGLNLAKLGKLWYALSSVALHTKLPTNKSEDVHPYGDPGEIRRQVLSALTGFEKLKSGTLISSALGANYSFPCETCGTEIRRILKLLKHNQVVNCVNSNCNETYQIHIQGDEVRHIQRVVSMPCYKCTGQVSVGLKSVDELTQGDTLDVPCDSCGNINLIQLIAVMVRSNQEAKCNEH